MENFKNEDWWIKLNSSLDAFTDKEKKKVSDGEISRSTKVSQSRKNQKATEKTKAILSKAHTGKKLSKEHMEKSRTNQIKTKWEQTLNRLSKEDILDAQVKHGNHQTNAFIELGISFRLGKKLCKYYGIELKKSTYEKSEFARIEQSEPIKVYLFDKTKMNGKGKFLNEYYSIAEASRQLNIEKSRGHIISVLKKKRPHTHGYYFEYKQSEKN